MGVQIGRNNHKSLSLVLNKKPNHASCTEPNTLESCLIWDLLCLPRILQKTELNLICAFGLRGGGKVRG